MTKQMVGAGVKGLLMDECPDRDKHTPCPQTYLAAHEWAMGMLKTHRQIRCNTCGLFAVWVPKT